MMIFYVDDQVFAVTAGERMFPPREVPHAFLIWSAEIDIITLTSPGGFFDVTSELHVPAKGVELPADTETLTYATQTSQRR